jgi:hypothetical protein
VTQEPAITATFSTEGMYNLAYKQVATMSATGAANNETKTGDINVKACNKNGIEYAELTMEGVNYSSEYNFNLFSISKLLKNGWKLNGDTKTASHLQVHQENQKSYSI